MPSRTLVKLQRYKSEVPEVCPYCLMNVSLGQTDIGLSGCRFCQKEVDDAIIEAGFLVVEQEVLSDV